MNLFECKNLVLGYGHTTVADNISFSVSQGDYLCIIGENGSGKSTLMKTLLGLETHLGGEVRVSLSPDRVGYMPQQSHITKDFPASVKEIVLSGTLGGKKLRSFYSKKDREKAALNMKRLGIEELSSKCYRELSGGQQQRVLLARALCAAKDILLLDEPASSLDSESTCELYSIIRSLNRDDGMTIIMITHDLTPAVNDASKILHLGDTNYFGSYNDFVKASAEKGGNADA